MGAATNIFGYVSEQASAGTPISYVALGILGVFAWFILYHLLQGLRRGIFRQILHTGIMLLAAALAFFATKYLANYIFGMLETMTLEELLAQIGLSGSLDGETMNLLGSIDMVTLEYILALPVGVIVAPVVFMALFAVLNILFRIVYLIVRGVAHVSKANGGLQRLTGMLLGAVEGLIIVSILFLPFTAITGAADEMMSAVAGVEENADESGDETADADEVTTDGSEMDLDAIYEEYLKPIAAHPAFELTRAIGGELVLDGLATYELAGNKINTREEFGGIMGVLLVDGANLMKADFNKLTEDDKTAMTNIVNYVDESDYMATIVAGVLNVMSDILKDQMADAGSAEGIDFVTPMFSIFENITADEVGGVLSTFKDFYFLISDEGVLEAISSGDNDTLAEMFTKTDAEGKTVLSKATAILNGNSRTVTLVTTLTKMTFAMMAESSEMGEEIEQVYTDVKDKVNATVDKFASLDTREEKVDTAKTDIAAALAENEIEIEAEIVDELAEELVSIVEKEGFTEFGEAEFNEVMLKYYDAYMKQMDEEGGAE